MRQYIIAGILGIVLGAWLSQFPRDNGWVSRPKYHVIQQMTGVASFYGKGFQGKPMANGCRFNKNTFVVAHRTLPLGTKVRVRRGELSVIAVITDRGPWVKGRMVDLSEGTAYALDMLDVGTATVTLEVLEKPHKSLRHHRDPQRCFTEAQKR